MIAIDDNNKLILISVDAIVSHLQWEKMPSYLDKHTRSQVGLHVHVFLPEARRSGRCWQVTEYVTSILHLFFTQKSMEKCISL